MSARADKGEQQPSDVRSARRGPKPGANSLPRGEPRHLDARTRAGPVDDRDGASARIVVCGDVRLRLLGDDLVARTAAGVDDGRIQDVRAEAGDVEERRVGLRGAALSLARAAPWEGAEYRRRCSPRFGAPRSRPRWCVAHAPTLDKGIEVCGHDWRARSVREAERAVVPE